MNLIFRLPCILLTCIYVQLCVCKYLGMFLNRAYDMRKGLLTVK